MPRKQTETLKVMLHKRTELSVLVSTDGERDGAVWMPLKLIEIDDDAMPGDDEFHDLVAPVWLIEDRGLA